MYQDSNLHGQMSKKLGLPQNHVKRNNISGQTQQQARHYHLAQAVITAREWKQWSLAGTLPGDVAILPFPPPLFFKIFIFSPSSDSISQNTAMRCCLPDRKVKRWGKVPLEQGIQGARDPGSSTVSCRVQGLHYLSDKYSLRVITLFQLCNDINKLGIQGIT